MIKDMPISMIIDHYNTLYIYYTLSNLQAPWALSLSYLFVFLNVILMHIHMKYNVYTN